MRKSAASRRARWPDWSARYDEDLSRQRRFDATFAESPTPRRASIFGESLEPMKTFFVRLRAEIGQELDEAA
jgi:hypothetical protein